MFPLVPNQKIIKKNYLQLELKIVVHLVVCSPDITVVSRVNQPTEVAV